jgi:hypothetical protein
MTNSQRLYVSSYAEVSVRGQLGGLDQRQLNVWKPCVCGDRSRFVMRFDATLSESARVCGSGGRACARTHAREAYMWLYPL